MIIQLHIIQRLYSTQSRNPHSVAGIGTNIDVSGFSVLPAVLAIASSGVIFATGVMAAAVRAISSSEVLGVLSDRRGFRDCRHCCWE